MKSFENLFNEIINIRMGIKLEGKVQTLSTKIRDVVGENLCFPCYCVAEKVLRVWMVSENFSLLLPSLKPRAEPNCKSETNFL